MKHDLGMVIYQQWPCNPQAESWLHSLDTVQMLKLGYTRAGEEAEQGLVVNVIEQMVVHVYSALA